MRLLPRVAGVGALVACAAALGCAPSPADGGSDLGRDEVVVPDVELSELDAPAETGLSDRVSVPCDYDTNPRPRGTSACFPFERFTGPLPSCHGPAPGSEVDLIPMTEAQPPVTCFVAEGCPQFLFGWEEPRPNYAIGGLGLRTSSEFFWFEHSGQTEVWSRELGHVVSLPYTAIAIAQAPNSTDVFALFIPYMGEPAQVRTDSGLKINRGYLSRLTDRGEFLWSLPVGKADGFTVHPDEGRLSVMAFDGYADRVAVLDATTGDEVFCSDVLPPVYNQGAGGLPWGLGRLSVGPIGFFQRSNGIVRVDVRSGRTEQQTYRETPWTGPGYESDMRGGGLARWDAETVVATSSEIYWFEAGDGALRRVDHWGFDMTGEPPEDVYWQVYPTAVTGYRDRIVLDDSWGLYTAFTTRSDYETSPISEFDQVRIGSTRPIVAQDGVIIRNGSLPDIVDDSGRTLAEWDCPRGRSQGGSQSVLYPDGTFLFGNCAAWAVWQTVHGGMAHTPMPGTRPDTGNAFIAPDPPYATEPEIARRYRWPEEVADGSE